MKLNGATKPHGGPIIGCSIGAKKYRDKRSNILNKLNYTADEGQLDSDQHTITIRYHHQSSSTKLADARLNKKRNKCYSKGKNTAMRSQQSSSLFTSFFRYSPSSSLLSSSTLLFCYIVYIIILQQPTQVLGDELDSGFFVNSFSLGPETTTPEFDYASRGKKKFGDRCDNTLECGFPGSVCDAKKKSCQCTDELPITNHIDKCGKEAAVNESCFFNEQCESFYYQTECRDGHCVCRFEMSPVRGDDGKFECKTRHTDRKGPERYVDPAMIGVLVGMALMFVIICVVLRLFSQARWRENRTIFNTPNPRLMNVSLLRESKLLQERRGSRMSVRGPSRQPSMASLRPHSPNPSLEGSRRGSRGSSNASATSVRSNRSTAGANNGHHDRKMSTAHQLHQQNQQQHLQHQHMLHAHPQQQPLMTNITSNPVAENVTVEIIEP